MCWQGEELQIYSTNAQLCQDQDQLISCLSKGFWKHYCKQRKRDADNTIHGNWFQECHCMWDKRGIWCKYDDGLQRQTMWSQLHHSIHSTLDRCGCGPDMRQRVWFIKEQFQLVVISIVAYPEEMDTRKYMHKVLRWWAQRRQDKFLDVSVYNLISCTLLPESMPRMTLDNTSSSSVSARLSIICDTSGEWTGLDNMLSESVMLLESVR